MHEETLQKFTFLFVLVIFIHTSTKFFMLYVLMMMMEESIRTEMKISWCTIDT